MVNNLLNRRFMAALLCGVVWQSARLACGEEPSGPPFRFLGGEKVRLIVPKEVGESVDQLVSPDGFVALPTGGAPVNIKGKTLPEAIALINQILEQRSGAKRATAALALVDAPPRRIYIGGEVKLPQAIALAAGAPLTLAAALAAAGGATPEGDPSRVSLVQLTADGKTETITFDATQAGKTGPALEPGAVITIPRGDIYHLAGEVARPGAINRRELSLRPGEPAYMTRVLFAGGGLKPAGNRKDIRIIRTSADGAREIIPVNLDEAIGGGGKSQENKDPILQDRDIILAGASGGVAILGKVKLPGVYPLNGDSLKLSRLIALAGGFNEFAKTSGVIVIRATAPKNPVRVDINSITRDGDLEKDLDLLDGDLVFVSERLL